MQKHFGERKKEKYKYLTKIKQSQSIYRLVDTLELTSSPFNQGSFTAQKYKLNKDHRLLQQFITHKL